MAMKKGGLGKGLDVLFAQNATEEHDGVMTLPLAEIQPDRSQPRKQFDEQALAELADSVAKHGILQPILVRPLPEGGYLLVAGERRWRAARMAGLTEVPVTVRQMDDRQAAEVALIENLQRENLNPVEQATGFQTLMDTYGLTQEQTAAAVGKSRPAIANALRLLTLPQPILELVQDGSLSAGHARTLLAFAPEQQQEMAERAVQEELSVRDLETLAKKAANPPKPKKQPEKAFSQDALYTAIEQSLTEHLGRRVKVTAGKLQFEFHDAEDLQALVKTLFPQE